MTKHPKGTGARILLSSVFGPYAQDDAFGSRTINPMELYHNQVTRAQGAFSLRMFHRSWGLLMIQRNISAPTTVLDFPTRAAFEAELTSNEYDIVASRRSSSTWAKCGRCAGSRGSLRPSHHRGGRTRGGRSGHRDDDRRRPHRARRGHLLDAPFPGEDETAPIAHPEIVSGFGARTLGVKLPQSKGTTAATIIPSVGCPWVATSAPPRRSSAARGSISIFTIPAKSCST